MKIVIATPLFPPDTAPSAQYAKELAARLAHDHAVTVVAYGHLPESESGVRIIAIEKSLMLPLRVISFFLSLLRVTKNADLLIVENGPSAEVPALLVSWLRPMRLIYSVSDRRARLKSAASRFSRMLGKRLSSRAGKIVESIPGERPEILPFSPRPIAAFAAWEAEWDRHLRAFETP